MNVYDIPAVIKESSRGYERVELSDELLLSREVFLTSSVDSDSMAVLLKQLICLYRQDPHAGITLYINSPGGEVTSGLAVFDFLKMFPAPVRTVCIGTAASMGAILFLAGDIREMFPSSRLMIHDPSFAGGTLAGMKPAEIEEQLSSLRKTQKRICLIIAEASGRSEEEILALTATDTYFDAEEAVAFGLATEVRKTL